MPPLPKSAADRGAAAVAPFKRPGQKLGYERELRAKRRWPPSKIPPKHGDRPTATPFLVIPAFVGDSGVRPLLGAEAAHSLGVQILDGAGAAVVTPVAGQTYMLRATVVNLGVTAAYAGLANFYVGPRAVFEQARTTPGATVAAQGRTGFVLLPWQTLEIDSPQPWTPSPADTTSSVVVEVYDLVLDLVTEPFDARNDRHVGRRDSIPDFSGVWDGTMTSDAAPGHRYLIRVTIMQRALAVDCAFYLQLGGRLPTNPQDTGSGSIVGDQISLVTTEYVAGELLATNTWNLSLTGPDALHLTEVEVFAPGDDRGTQHWVADLHRI
jgi:hypothetical protein